MPTPKKPQSQAELCQTCKTGVPHACGRIFFPPYELCRMMAAMMKPEIPKPGRLLMVDEPACGSGSMILAFHEEMINAGAPQNRLFYHLKDLDNRAFRMAYIQTSLCGLAAEVELGDTLRMTTDRIWRTPGYYLHDIPTRMRVDAMIRALPGDDSANKPEHSVAPENSETDSGRLPPGGCWSLVEAPSEAGFTAAKAAQNLDEYAPPLPDVIMPKLGENFSLF